MIWRTRETLRESSKIFVEHALQGYSFELRPISAIGTASSVTSTLFFLLQEFAFIIVLLQLVLVNAVTVYVNISELGAKKGKGSGFEEPGTSTEYTPNKNSQEYPQEFLQGSLPTLSRTVLKRSLYSSSSRSEARFTSSASTSNKHILGKFSRSR